MIVELADKAGFCFGVNRAVDTVYKEVDSGNVYTYGPIIHNAQVISDLEQKGAHVVDSLEEAQDLAAGDTIILRSHGVTRAEHDALAAAGLHIVDATCPFVSKIHTIVDDYSRRGYFIIIIGNPYHPEVRGVIGWADAAHCAVISNADEAASLKVTPGDKLCIVAQTTFNHKKFKELVEIIEKKEYIEDGTVGWKDICIHNTICSATRERQDAAEELSRRVDAMIVIGGADSSNTRKLYEICSMSCKDTYFIQTPEDLTETDFSRFDHVGITAGASTPHYIIEEVQKYVRKL
ncbi:MAG: 4-hydroxy-3-methylbut-2-enyl diphosphate reductase [Clostridiales bacterium]|nr:4-hydroxy-3-methylbut-2-enyl diphosphate reductase [Clostridiales bacterium]